MASELPEETLTRIRDRVERGGSLPSILILPSAVRSGEALYSEFDIDAAKNARDSGLEVEFLHPASERRYLGEYSAGVVLGMAIAVLQDLTVDGLKAIGTYCMAQVTGLRRDGLIEEGREPTLRITAALVQVRPDEIKIKELKVEAQGDQAIAMLLPLLAGPAKSAEALQQLGIRSQAPELPMSSEHED